MRDNGRENECNSETNKQTKNQFEKCQVAPGVRTEKGHFAPEVKIANEIICDHIWDNLYSPFL
jgi:hypothetical protein